MASPPLHLAVTVPTGSTTAAPRSTTNACPSPGVPATAFTDVPNTNTHAWNIACVVWWQVAHGTSTTTYQPSIGTPRDQMAAFVARLIRFSGGSLLAAPPDAFSDDNGDPFEADINALAAAGIVHGNAGHYNPHQVVTRGEMAAYLVRAFNYRSSGTLSHTVNYFTDDDSSVFDSVINDAAAVGFTGGFADGTYRPDGPVLRDQMASFLARTLDLLVVDHFTAVPTQ